MRITPFYRVPLLATGVHIDGRSLNNNTDAHLIAMFSYRLPGSYIIAIIIAIMKGKSDFNRFYLTSSCAIASDPQ